MSTVLPRVDTCCFHEVQSPKYGDSQMRATPPQARSCGTRARMLAHAVSCCPVSCRRGGVGVVLVVSLAACSKSVKSLVFCVLAPPLAWKSLGEVPAFAMPGCHGLHTKRTHTWVALSLQLATLLGCTDFKFSAHSPTALHGLKEAKQNRWPKTGAAQGCKNTSCCSLTEAQPAILKRVSCSTFLPARFQVSITFCSEKALCVLIMWLMERNIGHSPMLGGRTEVAIDQSRCTITSTHSMTSWPLSITIAFLLDRITVCR